MADQIQFRGGTSTEHSTFTGALREITIDTTKKTAVVHDGATIGGIPLLRQDLGNLPAGTIDNADIASNAAIAYSKLAPLNNGNIVIGNASNVATSVALSGDIAISNTGVTSIAAGAIVDADISATAAIDKTKISGTAITAGDVGTITSGMIANDSIVNADIKTDAGISFSKLQSLNSGEIIVGNASNIATGTAITGDVTISNTGVTTVVSGTTSTAGKLQLTDSTSSTSTTTAATPNAVKAAYDLANSALPKTGGTMTGAITFAAGQTLSGYAALATAQSFTAAQRGSISALTSAATVTADFAIANNFSLTLGHNVTLANPSNLTAGQSGSIVITQAASGGPYTVSFGSNWKFPGGTVPTKTSTASSVCVIVYYVESASRITAQMLNDVKV